MTDQKHMPEKIVAALDDAGCLQSGTIQGDNEIITIEDYSIRIITNLFSDLVKRQKRD